MSLEGFSNLIEAAAKLLGTMVWPAVFVYVAVRFGSDIGKFLSDLGEITFKGVGIEATAKRQKVEAGAALAAAAVSRSEQDAVVSDIGVTKRAAQTVKAITASTMRRIEGSRILWVDDRPSNNEYERQAIEVFGVEFAIAISTEDALSKLDIQSFDVIISDMGRPPDSQAGYTLLDKIRSLGDRTPFIIYSNSRSLEHQEEARRRGAIGCTNDPTELFEMVISALKR